MVAILKMVDQTESKGGREWPDGNRPDDLQMMFDVEAGMYSFLMT